MKNRWSYLFVLGLLELSLILTNHCDQMGHQLAQNWRELITHNLGKVRFANRE